MQTSSAVRSHVWHQMTNPARWEQAPGPRIVRAEGAYLWDAAGERVIDGNSGLQNVHIGHGRAAMAEAAAAQIRELDYFPVYNGTHAAVEALADDLHAKLPDFDRFLFHNSGSEANEASLKLLREYWLLRGEPQRTVVISRFNSYHGATLGALAPTGRGKGALREPFEPFLLGSRNISDPAVGEGEDERAASERLARELRETIAEVGAERVMALFAEPIQQHRALVPPAGYFAALHEVCREHRIPLVADEVITGFGRTGTWLGCEDWGFLPDLIVLGKGLASGYAPIAAVGVGAEIAAAFDAAPDRIFHQLSTTAGHPVACRLARENLRILAEEELVERSRVSGELLRDLLRQAFADRPEVESIDGAGLLNAVVFDPAQVPTGLAENAVLRRRCFERGAYIRVDGQIWLIPPLSTDAALLEQLVAIAREATDAWLAGGEL